ncbi:unnamed protein product [Rotaria sp. Silwood2]|nr:unnamed protein product [Rotaria sp. Silwood2]CAF3959748.1 unnamed protein product [Rotaria sp. Silwood2]CAF3980018.1 unnamed protein product [Rotaria sp. Silwood2]CAF4439559.1 unnamed protein product [Rotaria sp. Silwood2]
MNEEQLREYCCQHLPSYMIPSRFILLEQMPLNQSGKLDRMRLPCVEPARVHRQIRLPSALILSWLDVDIQGTNIKLANVLPFLCFPSRLLSIGDNVTTFDEVQLVPFDVDTRGQCTVDSVSLSNGVTLGKVSKELYDLSERLRKARIDDDYVESDLCTWTTMLEKLRRDLTTIAPLINIYEDPTKILVTNICISETELHIKQNENFGESLGNIRIEENGCVAIHIGSRKSDAFVRGICEYSLDKHKIRLFVKKNTTACYCFFGII